jgi:hypothetical protein
MSLDDALELSCETVAEAIRCFRERVLIPGKWDPTRKASLRTFFVGQCILQFPNIYRRWNTEQSLGLLPEGLEAEVAPFATVEQVVELRRLIPKLPPGALRASVLLLRRDTTTQRLPK